MTVNPGTSVAPSELSCVQQSLRHKVILCKIFVSEHHLLQKTSRYVWIHWFKGFLLSQTLEVELFQISHFMELHTPTVCKVFLLFYLQKGLRSIKC